MINFIVNIVVLLIFCFVYVFLAVSTHKIIQLLISCGKIDEDMDDDFVMLMSSILFPIAVPVIIFVLTIRFFMNISYKLIDIIINFIKNEINSRFKK